MTKKKKKRTGQLYLPSWLEAWRVQVIGIGLLGALLYVNTIGHQYAQDDAIVITENVLTQQGLEGLSGIFSNDTFFGFFQDKSKARLVTGGRYRPLSVATFALETAIWGQNPSLSHALNAMLYGFLCALILLTLRLSIRDWPAWEKALIPFVVTLLFTTHPVHTEAVANIKGRDEILALLGAIGAWYMALKAIDRSSWMLHLLGACLLFLGMLSKENAFTFIGIIPMMWYVFRKKSIQEVWLPALPYLGSGILFLLLRSAILPEATGEPSMELMNNPFLVLENGQYELMTFSEKLPTIVYTWGRYLQLLFAPIVLTHDYYPKHIALQSWSDPAVLISMLIYIAGIWVAFRGVLKRAPIAFGIAFFLVALLPVSNLLFPIGTNMAERLLFMPSLGWAIAVGWLLVRLVQRFAGQFPKVKDLRWISTVLIALILISILFSIRTINRNEAWKNNYTLFTQDVRVSDQSAKLQNAVGGELLARSQQIDDPTEQKILQEKAVGHLERAIAIHPYYKNAYLLLGNAFN
ncbi:MAG: tetratricopeptide repeat protein, partial [Saprospiraceae bacterium]|nr:tetratricopeptide repeat protein [Saprospiraceae bacterium]